MRAKIAPNRLIAEFNTLAVMGLFADSARPQRVSGSARTDSRRAESARNPIASHVNFGDDSPLSTFKRTQWTASLTGTDWMDLSMKQSLVAETDGEQTCSDIYDRYAAERPAICCRFCKLQRPYPLLSLSLSLWCLMVGAVWPLLMEF